MYKPGELHFYKIIFIYITCIITIASSITSEKARLELLISQLENGTIEFKECKALDTLLISINQNPDPPTKQFEFIAKWSGNNPHSEVRSCYDFSFQTERDQNPVIQTNPDESSMFKPQFQKVDLSKFEVPLYGFKLPSDSIETIGLYKIIYNMTMNTMCMSFQKSVRKKLPKNRINATCYFYIRPRPTPLLLSKIDTAKLENNIKKLEDGKTIQFRNCYNNIAYLKDPFNRNQYNKEFEFLAKWTGVDPESVATSCYDFSFDTKRNQKPEIVHLPKGQITYKDNWTNTKILPEYMKFNGFKFPSYTKDSLGLWKITYNMTMKDACKSLRWQIKKKLPNDRINTKCYFWMGPSKPMVMIKGGSYREVAENTAIIVESVAYDPNTHEVIQQDLFPSYRWIVKRNGRVDPHFKRTKTPKITLKGPFTKLGTHIESNSFVFLIGHQGDKDQQATDDYRQEIKVIKASEYIGLDIVCRKNCMPFTLRSNHQSETFMEVKCTSSCANVKYTWTIYMSKKLEKPKWEPVADFDYDRDTGFGRHNERFIVKKRVLKLKYIQTMYKMEVTATGPKSRKSTASMTVAFSSPNVLSCSITPPKGISFQTKFKYECRVQSYGEGSIRLELYFDHPDEGGKNLYSDLSYLVKEALIFLPPSKGHKFFVKGTFNEERVFDILEIKDIEVEPLFDENTSGNQVVQMIDNLYYSGDKSIDKLMKSSNSKDRNQALATLSVLLENVKFSNTEDKKIKQAIDSLKYKLCEGFIGAPMDNMDDIMQFSDSIVNIMSMDQSAEEGPDPFLYKMTQLTCKQLAQTQLTVVQKQKYQQTYDFEAQYAADKLVQCTEVNGMPNQSAVKPIDLNLTTVIPTVTSDIVENYPDYLDYTEEYYRNLVTYKDATNCAVNVTILSAKVMALTMTSGEDTTTKTFGKAELLVAKDQGSDLYKRTMESQGVRIIPSADWKNSDHDFDILVSTWSRDIMWWNPNHTKVASSIIKVEFWHSTCKDRVDDFIEPADLIFKLNTNETNHILVNDSISINGNSEMSLFRVKLNVGEMLNIAFFNLTKDDFLDVTLTINSIPTREDFIKKNITVTINSTIYYTNPYKRVDYAYIGVLPNANMTKKSNLNYSTSYSSVACVTWQANTSRWVPQCDVGPLSNLTHINCRCTHFSVISTIIAPKPAIKVKLQVEKDFLMVLNSRYVVFGTILIVFAIYCGFCTFFFKHHSEEVFFLADNIQSNEYGYVIIIRTGSGSHASTSSNVVIKLTGDKAASEPHLLNYPDPQMRILQRNNQDIFVLTTKESLGDRIKLLELWYDSIGFNATWYCQDVYIYDLQKRTHWYFKVKKQLCVVSGVTYIAVSSDDDNNTGRKKRWWCTVRIKVCDATHGWMFLREEETFSRFQRLTLLLSNIMLTFLLVMIWHPLPKFDLSDCFDQRTHFRIDDKTAMKGSLCALVSFGLHFCIGWLMRILKRGGIPYLIFTKLCWILVFLNIYVSMNALVIFGFWIPLYSSLEWLLASLFGLSISALFYENFLIMIRSMLNLRWKPDMMWRYNLIMEAIQEQKSWLFHTFGPELLRPYFGHVYVPMTEEQEHIRRNIILSRRLVLEQLWDFVMFSIYILILYMVILMNKSSVSQLSNNTMRIEMEGILTRTMGFSDISTFLDVYTFMEKTLIPVLQDPHWYGNFVLADPGLMIDMNNKYLGVVRLRQHRMPKDLCLVADKMKFLNMSCWPEFTYSLAETGAFSYRWEKEQSYLMFDRLQGIWDYTSAALAGTLPMVGTFATYTGGGYVSFLGRTYHNSVANFVQLKEKKWIDEETRCIFIEFLTYNVNHNEFNAITMTFEQSATGYLNKKVTVQTARMLFIESTFETIKRTVFALFIIWVGMLMLKQSSAFMKKIKSFYKDLWFYIDFFIISMSVVCIGTFYIRTLLIGDYVDKLTVAKHNEFVNYFELFYLEDFLTIFGAVLVCVATIRIWRFLRFGKVFRMMERTISLSGSGLLSILFLHLVFILAYAMAGIMLYAIEFEDFYSTMAAIRTLMLLVMFASYVDYDNYISSNPVSYFYFGTYSLVVIVIMTLYGIMLMEAYVRAQRQFEEEEDRYNIKHYFQEKLKYWPIKWRYKILKLKGGGDDEVEEKTFIRLKSGDVRHENSISMQATKLQEITSYARCIMKKMFKPKGKILVLPREMMDIVLIHLRKLDEKRNQQEEDNANEEENEEAVFFTGHLPGQRIKCIDENRILLIKTIVEKMLKPNNSTIANNVVKPNNKIQQCSNILRKTEKSLTRTNLNLELTLAKFAQFKNNLEESLKTLPKNKKL